MKNILIVMAYTDDYTIGILCEAINQFYCQQRQYCFLSKVLSCHEMLSLIEPKLHFTWYKIYLFREIMSNLLQNNRYYHDPHQGLQEIDYLFWIDADACILDFTQSIETILEQAQYKPFIIAEDLHTCCFINAGVFLLKVCPWSAQFLEDIWKTKKYDTVFYYEQSAMMKVLNQQYKEGFEKRKPFHSFVKNGNMEIKMFSNVAVFPHRLFSSNCVMTKEEVQEYLQRKAGIVSNEEKDALNEERNVELTLSVENKEDDRNDSNDGNDGNMRKGERIPFIYHAAGVKNKLGYLRAVIEKFALPLPTDIPVDNLVFQLRRTTLGHYISPSEDHARKKRDEHSNIVSTEEERKPTTVNKNNNNEILITEDIPLTDLFEVNH